ncbi:M20/M25/M40 family metallo-hydrolase [Vreelandella olivaria]|uniref:M20/M25/M40 family metallo-hydrolase n=1 Tax=Vreelandella olivaria TaxID=390919 RepID=UPI00201EF265|nr:M20/M25/M40 family metallo-hydrolase [Halomonas olivaria]
MDELKTWLDRRADEQVSMLQQLVQVPSDNPPGDGVAHALRATELLEQMGFEVEQHPVPDAICRQYGLQKVMNLVVRHRFGSGPTVALNAHGDVVPAGGGWSKDPYGGEIEQGWLYGRGAAVSKSDFVTYAYALKALIETGELAAGCVELHFTYDEETGGFTGPAWLLSEGISQPDYAVCAAFSYQVITAHNGCLHLEVAIEGRSAHAAWHHTGIDAIEASLPVLSALYRYRETLKERVSEYPGVDSPSLVIGTIEGGINTNVVPDRVSLTIDRRIIPEESPEAVEQELRALIEAASSHSGIRLNVTQRLLAKPFTSTPVSEQLAEMFAVEAQKVLGEPVGVGAMPLYTDARHYSEAGVPTIMYGAGPRNPLDANGHRADERVPVQLVTNAALVVANSLKRLLT